jgi:ankyrin repeat protein
MELLLAAGAGVNAKDGRGMTPLYWASRLGVVGTIELLLSRGARVHAADRQGVTALLPRPPAAMPPQYEC